MSKHRLGKLHQTESGVFIPEKFKPTSETQIVLSDKKFI